MKNMKKFASILLALVMLLAIAAPAMAEAVNNGTKDHKYEAYQVFTGTQAANDSTLGNVQWGTGVNGDALLAELKEDYDYFDACTTAADVADVLNGKNDNCDEAKALAATATKHLTSTKISVAADATTVELTPGYWLIVDVTETGVNDARNAALLQVTKKGDINITTKYDVPEVEKKVSDTADGSTELEDTADVNIGDTVTFTLTATMPSTLEGYETYKVIFNDTMSEGLTFKAITSVKVAGVDTEAYTSATGDVADTTGKYAGGTTLTVTIDDVLALGAVESSKIVVTYTATVNDKAVIGTAGNLNKVSLEYSNDPNWNGDGEEPTGDTPEEEVKVYTWEIPVFKWTEGDTADEKTPLAGAGFTLYKDDAKVNLVASDIDNIYKVCTQTDCTHTHVTEIVTDDTGLFEIEGLEKGTYTLKETTTPAGYNTCEDISVTIGENGVLTIGEGKGAFEDGKVSVENESGRVLPETGGMGTTAIYAMGSLLIAGAALALLMKKRVAA